MVALSDADHGSIRRVVEEKWVQAALDRDWDAALALCTEDVVYMPQEHPALHGRDEMRSFLNGFPTIVNIGQRLDDVSGDTDLAVARGGFWATLRVEGQEMSGKGKFLGAMTKRNGTWFFTAVCFNWDAPLGA